jgi:hypothetical protein
MRGADRLNRIEDETGHALCPRCAFDDAAMRCQHHNFHPECCPTCNTEPEETP